MPSILADSLVFGPLFSTEEMKKVFSDENRVQKWLDTEAALAKVQGKLGMIPQEAADEINRKADAKLLNIASIGEFYKSSITIVPLLKAFKEVLDNNAGEYAHWGTTSQDIVDTGLILQIKEAHAIIVNRVNVCIEAAKVLTKKYRDTVMAGRTHVQHALPITFGFKVGIMLWELERQAERLQEIKKRLFIGQISGAVGTLASMEDKGFQVQEGVFKELDLIQPVISWHPMRDHIAEFINLLALIAGTVARINHEVLTMQRTEVGEVEEPFFMGKVGSSTMPHKRNPQVCENVIALCKKVRALAPLAVDCMITEHERDWGCEIAEWDFVPDACIALDAALVKTVDLLQHMIVYPEKMEQNLNKLNGLMLSESVMINLATRLGRMESHEIVYQSCMEAFEKNISMIDIMMANPAVTKHFSEQEIRDMLDPAKYVGLAPQFVDRVLNHK